MFYDSANSDLEFTNGVCHSVSKADLYYVIKNANFA